MADRDVAPVACEGRQVPFQVVPPGSLRPSRRGDRENQAGRKKLDRAGRTSHWLNRDVQERIRNANILGRNAHTYVL